jgi:hypothetical protein
MSAHRFRRVDRRTAEQLLRGAPDPEHGAGPDALSTLLAAASAPARAEELAGEQAALAAFRAARLADAPQPRRPSMLKVTLAKLATVKIAATAAAVLVAGGVAVAAATGGLPTQGNDTPPAVPSTIDKVTSSAASDGAPGKSDKKDNGQPNGEKSNGDKNNNDNAGTPSPSLTGLCHAYTAGSKSERGKALESPAFTYLITTAGGKDKVPAYCSDLLAKEPKQQPEHPTGKPTTNPGNGPADPPANDKANGGPPETRPGR